MKLAATPPQQRQEQPQPRWTLKRLVSWIKAQFNINCCRDTVGKTLKRLGLSWKKGRKLLKLANSDKRAKFLETLKILLNNALQNGQMLIYIDEAHIHLDTDEGYGWSIKGERFWVSSSSPGRTKVSFYGVYIYNLGEVRIFPSQTANGLNTIDVLKTLKAEFPFDPIDFNLGWGSLSSLTNCTIAVATLDIKVEPLPAYSPDFMPVEHLWQWLRSDVTYHTCYEHQSDLIEQVSAFQQRINACPNTVADRLWVTTNLKPDEEKLRVST